MVAFFSPAIVIPRAPLTLSYINSGVASSNTISIPASAAIGDLAILFEYAVGGIDPTQGTPSGYTLVKRVPGGGGQAGSQCFYRVLTAASGSVSTGTTLAGGEINTLMFIYRPSKAITSVTPSTWNGQITVGNPNSQTVDPSALTVASLVLALAGSFSSAFTFSTASPAFDATLTNDSGSGYAIAGRKLYNTSPASHSIDMADVGTSNILISGYLAVA
jgi:hypothetical protein